MVVFVDFDEDSAEPPDRFREQQSTAHGDWRQLHHANPHSPEYKPPIKEEERQNPNFNVMTEALGCYPIITSISTHLDLNTLDSLSKTCRQIRLNLLQFRKQVIAHTLRCSNEHLDPDPEHTLRFRARAADFYFLEPEGAGRTAAVGTGKVGDCARDLVGGCRRCGRVVCRNCTIKPPAPILLKNRHRRLCPACIRAPIATLLAVPSCESKPSTPSSSTPSTPTAHSPTLSFSKVTSSKGSLPAELRNQLLLEPTYCTCPFSTYLCTPCGRTLRSSDSSYDSIWRWRTRYGGSGIGGLGTGMGEGNRSFECGRGSECSKAKWVEEERDCDAEDARGSNNSDSARNGSVSDDGSIYGSLSSASLGSTASSYGSERSQTPGYLRHEIEGIGGVVKKKLVRMVKVGACVTEWEDERERGVYLVREVEGSSRSWCGWCHRVVLGEKDLLELELKS